ncbi:hypothetical protein ACETK8_02545 [Brevundimonas staleyi]|uniref:Uncharacterized protein n=1 Tax=Brevundimonas staleyi TaxID=74326 RepID=A0ABW0FUL5_9CAUL
MDDSLAERQRGWNMAALFISAAAGAYVVSLLHEGRFRLFWDMKATDWTAVVLACSALILTAVGIFVAILALWGWSTIKRDSVAAARREAKRCVDAYLVSPEAEATINRAVEQWFNRNADQGTLMPYIAELVRRGNAMTEFDAEVDEAWGEERAAQDD